MATIIKQSREFTKQEQYKLIVDDTSVSFTKAEGMIISPIAWVEYTDTNMDGKMVDVLAVLDEDGEVYSTISDVFKRHFWQIVDLMEGEPFAIRVIAGESKNGRKFVSCKLA
jgi:hypothetical protein